MEQHRKKELQAAYKARKPEMGVICFRWEATGESFLGASQDTQKDYNSNQFKLSMGGHPNRRMQALWNQYGPEAMTFSVLETLSYEDPQEDHSEELELLREIWLEKDPQAKKIWR